MPGPLTVDDLVTQTRDGLDEANVQNITDAAVLQALNRAQRKAAAIVARRYEDLLLENASVTTTATSTYDIPEAAYGRRVEYITVERNGTSYPLKRVTYRDLYKYTSSATTNIPLVYAIHGRTYEIKPTPVAGVTLKLWYTKAPETLVVQQGRITSVSVASSYILVDTLGSDLTTSTDALGAFVNIVDAQTGEIKTTLQINALTTATKKVAFKTSGLTLASVYNRTVDTAIPTDVAVNDYVCAIQGTCVPDFPDECLDYMVQHAVVSIKRRLGEPVQDDEVALKEQEAVLESLWAGRESSRRITNNSRSWNR